MRCIIADSHNDFMTTIKSKKQREEYIKECVQNGVEILGCAVFTNEYNFSVEDIKRFKQEIDKLSNRYGASLLFCIEDLGFIKSIQDLYKLIELKPFSVSLTWNYLNQYAGGADTSQGLTQLGKRVVKLLEENNILVDTAHLSRAAFDEFAKITELPIYNSHSNIYEMFSHNRNLKHWQIQQIVQSGGYLGLTIYNRFISNSKISSKKVVQQFDYLINKFGINNFGFGSDLCGFDLNFSPTDIKGYNDFYKVADSLTALWHNKDTVEKIMYNNFLQFCLKLK